MELVKRISIIHRYGRSYMEDCMLDKSIGSGQYTFILYLFAHNGVSQDTISHALAVDKATTTRAIQKLERQGFIYREKHPEDARVNLVFLTEKGKAVRNELAAFGSEWEETLLEGFTEEEIQLIDVLIGKLTSNAIRSKYSTLI
ncbi:MarR family winged helix-turn-helix transcriptional regulator [Fusibacter sp. JL298sf-3]